MISEGKQVLFSCFPSQHTQVQALAQSLSGSSFLSHRHSRLGRILVLEETWQIKSLIFVEVTRPLFNSPPRGHCRLPGRDSHFNANCSPFSAHPLPSAFPGAFPPALCSLPKCIFTRYSKPCPCLPPLTFLWNSERSRLSEGEDPEFGSVCNTRLIPVRFTVGAQL